MLLTGVGLHNKEEQDNVKHEILNYTIKTVGLMQEQRSHILLLNYSLMVEKDFWCH